MSAGIMNGPSRSARAEWTLSAARARLFLSSYASLFLILAVRFSDRGLRIACALLFVAGVADTWRITRKARKQTLAYVITIRSLDDVGAEVGGYLASYLLPFVVVPDPTGADIVGYLLFLLVALIIYVRSDLVRVNPTFYVLGYRVLRIRLRSGSQQYLLTRHEPRLDDKLRVVDVAGIVLDAGGANANSE